MQILSMLVIAAKVTEDQVIEAVVKHGAKTVKEVNAITGAMKILIVKKTIRWEYVAIRLSGSYR